MYKRNKVNLSVMHFTFIFLVASPFGWNHKGHFTNQNAKCSMQVWINQSIDRVSGRPWPRYDDGRPLGMTTTDGPCETTLHLPDGRTLNLHSKSTTLEQDRGIVTAVITLPLFTLVDFKTAVAKAQALSHRIGVNDPKFYETILAWGSKAPTTDSLGFPTKYMVRAILESSVDFYVELKQDWKQEGWFISLDFET